MAAGAFHPDLQRPARWLPRGPVGPRTFRPIRTLTGLAGRRSAEGVTVEPAGMVTVRVHRPTAGEGPWPALLWIHGGGYVIGTAAQDDDLCRHLAGQLGIMVAAVDYRLAPERPFPIPLHDCYDALTWLAGRPEVDPDHLAVGGGSAGGGLAAALALLARDRGEIAPVLQLLSYPMLDDRTAVRTDIDERHVRLWNSRANRFGWEAYTGAVPGSAGISPLAAPARCDDLSGLPPAWIGVGTLDLFYEEDCAYAERLGAAGVECQLEVVPGAFHGFDSVAPTSGVARQFRAAQAAALTAALH